MIDATLPYTDEALRAILATTHLSHRSNIERVIGERVLARIEEEFGAWIAAPKMNRPGVGPAIVHSWLTDTFENDHKMRSLERSLQYFQENRMASSLQIPILLPNGDIFHVAFYKTYTGTESLRKHP